MMTSGNEIAFSSNNFVLMALKKPLANIRYLTIMCLKKKYKVHGTSINIYENEQQMKMHDNE